MPPITILIAEDHPVFRKGLREILSGDEAVRIVRECGTAAEALQAVAELAPDVLLLDLDLPDRNGLEVARALRDQESPVKIIVLTMHKEEGVVHSALDLGVHGYVVKEAAASDIVDSVRAVSADRYYISPMISDHLVHWHNKKASLLRESPGLADLTPTERKILRMIAEEKTSREIAALMFLGTRTIENHRMAICNKLGVHGSNALLKFAIANKSLL